MAKFVPVPKFKPQPKGLAYLFGGGFDESIIKLVISHEHLDPKEVTALLRRKPTTAFAKGDLSANGKIVRQFGRWMLETRWIAKVPFEKNLAAFLKKLPADARVWRERCSRYDCSLKLLLRLRTWNRGGQITPSAIREIAARGLTLELDIYHDDDEKLWADKKG